MESQTGSVPSSAGDGGLASQGILLFVGGHEDELNRVENSLLLSLLHG